MEGKGKRPIVEKLESLGTPFVDVGMGITVNDDRLRGQIRTTTSTLAKRNHVYEKNRIAFTTADGVNEYDKNIQVAELNAPRTWQNTKVPMLRSRRHSSHATFR